MTEWLMVIITAIYVIATIFICKANIKSAKASQELLAEQKKQFDELNRAFVTVHFEVTPTKLYTLCVTNQGNKIARNVNLKFDDSFIESINNKDVKRHLINTKKSKINIGISQKWYLRIGVLGDRDLMSKNVNISLTYEDDKRKYNEYCNIDLSSFNWQLLCSPEDVQYEQTKKLIDSLNKINKSLDKIAEKIL